MPLHVSVPELLSDLAADGSAITLDLPGNGYDKLHELIEKSGALPQSPRGRMTLIALVLLASRIVKQQLGSLGPFANFFNELGEDGVREEAKRIIETVRSAAPPESPNGTDALLELNAEDRAQLLSLYEHLDEAHRRRLRAHLLKATALRLAILARLSPDQLKLVLDIVTPAQTSAPSVSSIAGHAMGSVNEFFFPWMRLRRGATS